MRSPSASPFSASLLLALLLALLPSCHEVEDYDTDPVGVFDCMVDVVGSRYCFFAEKDIDWQARAAEYRRRIIPDISQDELFTLMSELLFELEDGHVNLVSPFDVSYYREWWSAYPQDFDLRVVQENYLDFDWRTTCGIVYKILPSNVGYLYYPSFNYEVGPGNLDYILDYLSVCKALIIDVRDNGGGNLSNIRTFVGRLIHERTRSGYIQHKTGPGPTDFSEPYPIDYEPVEDDHVVWDKPVAVLANRSCFSAANDFVSVMKQCPNVKIVGARTGGGGGMPFTYPLPNGWKVRFSACPVTDCEGRSIEEGIDPSPGCEVHCTSEQLAAGTDAILDFAIALFP